MRNFLCPETEEPCINGLCTKVRCRDREQLQAAMKKEEIDKQQRVEDAEVWETIKPFLRPKNST